MRIASLKPSDLAVVQGDAFVLISDRLAQDGLLPKGASMIDLIAQYDSLKGAIARAVERGTGIEQDPKKQKLEPGDVFPYFTGPVYSAM